MRSRAELDAHATAFVKDMLAGIGQVTDLGDGLLQVTEKPPEIEPPPNMRFADIKPGDRMRRLKGREVGQVRVFIDGAEQTLDRTLPLMDLEVDCRKNEYLGNTTTRFNGSFKGGMIKLEFKVTSKHGLRPLLEGVWSERTRTGAWLVFGKGPRHRYRTKALAEREVQRRRKAKGGGR